MAEKRKMESTEEGNIRRKNMAEKMSENRNLETPATSKKD